MKAKPVRHFEEGPGGSYMCVSTAEVLSALQVQMRDGNGVGEKTPLVCALLITAGVVNNSGENPEVATYLSAIGSPAFECGAPQIFLEHVLDYAVERLGATAVQSVIEDFWSEHAAAESAEVNDPNVN